MRNNTLCPCFHNFTVAVAIKTPTSASPHTRTQLGNFRGGLRIMAPKCRAHRHYSGQNYKCTQKTLALHQTKHCNNFFPLHNRHTSWHYNWTMQSCIKLYSTAKNDFLLKSLRETTRHTPKQSTLWHRTIAFNMDIIQFTSQLYPYLMSIGINNSVRTMCV